MSGLRSERFIYFKNLKVMFCQIFVKQVKTQKNNKPDFLDF